MPNVLTERSATDNSARLFASMTRPAQSTNNVTTVSANLYVAAMRTVTVKKSARVSLVLWDVDQAPTAQTASLASTINVLIHAVPRQPHVVPMPYAAFPITRPCVVAHLDWMEIQPNSAHTPSRSANPIEIAPRVSHVTMVFVHLNVHHLLTTASSMKSVSAVSANLSVTAKLTATLAMFVKSGSALLVAKLTVSALKVKLV
jgi:hypothetical protein